MCRMDSCGSGLARTTPTSGCSQNDFAFSLAAPRPRSRDYQHCGVNALMLRVERDNSQEFLESRFYLSKVVNCYVCTNSGHARFESSVLTASTESRGEKQWCCPRIITALHIFEHSLQTSCRRLDETNQVLLKPRAQRVKRRQNIEQEHHRKQAVNRGVGDFEWA